MSCASPYSSRLSRQSNCSRRDNALCCCCATCSAGLPPRPPFCSIRRSHRPIARSNALGPHLGSSSRRASPTRRHPCQCQTISSGHCSTAMSVPGRMQISMGLSRCCAMTRVSACRRGRTGIADERPSGSCWSGFGGHRLTALTLSISPAAYRGEWATSFRGLSARREGDEWRAHTLQVLTLHDGAVAAITAFRDPRFVVAFGFQRRCRPKQRGCRMGGAMSAPDASAMRCSYGLLRWQFRLMHRLLDMAGDEISAEQSRGRSPVSSPVLALATRRSRSAKT